MNERYNLDNLEALFRQWLLAGKMQNYAEDEIPREITQKKALTNISVKNYLSDLRHFIGWLIFKLKVKNEKLKIEENLPISLLSQINPELIEDYKSYLLLNNIPVKTINRRLSALRKFCSFCISQGWMKENPAKHVGNVSQKPQIKTERTQMPPILNEFGKDLQKEINDPQLIKSYLEDVWEFFTYANKT